MFTGARVLPSREWAAAYALSFEPQVRFFDAHEAYARAILAGVGDLDALRARADDEMRAVLRALADIPLEADLDEGFYHGTASLLHGISGWIAMRSARLAKSVKPGQLAQVLDYVLEAKRDSEFALKSWREYARTGRPLQPDSGTTPGMEAA